MSEDDGAIADAVWLQLEIYAADPEARATVGSALREVLERLEAGETLGPLRNVSGEEIGWFDARPDNDATE